jgi:hypothetical protein
MARSPGARELEMMKVTIACGLCVALCLLSLAARSSMLARQRAAVRAAPVPARVTSERSALEGLDRRLGSRVHRLARVKVPATRI